MPDVLHETPKEEPATASTLPPFSEREKRVGGTCVVGNASTPSNDAEVKTPNSACDSRCEMHVPSELPNRVERGGDRGEMETLQKPSKGRRVAPKGINHGAIPGGVTTETDGVDVGDVFKVESTSPVCGTVACSVFSCA